MSSKLLPPDTVAAAGQTIRAEIDSNMAGQRLDRALVELAGASVPALSRARVQALIKAGHVTLAGNAVQDASRKVKAGEAYAVHLPPPEDARPKAQAIDLAIVYEDKDVIVIDKPAGLVVHPAPGNRDRTLVNALLAHCGKSLSGIGGVARPGIVHRLDKDTSGLIVVAKNDAAHQALTKQFADRSLSRTYQAIVWGAPPPSGSVDAPIGRHAVERKKMAVTAKGRAALTYYKVLKVFGDKEDTPSPAKAKDLLRKSKLSLPLPSAYAKASADKQSETRRSFSEGGQGERKIIASLIECKLATGRTHQIRVHLAHIKHPVVGDPVYGRRGAGAKGTEDLHAFPRQALHAVRLAFIHPRTGKAMQLSSPLPADMVKLLRRLGKHGK